MIPKVVISDTHDSRAQISATRSGDYMNMMN